TGVDIFVPRGVRRRGGPVKRVERKILQAGEAPALVLARGHRPRREFLPRGAAAFAEPGGFASENGRSRHVRNNGRRGRQRNGGGERHGERMGNEWWT